MNQFPSEAQVARIRQNYPIETRILGLSDLPLEKAVQKVGV